MVVSPSTNEEIINFPVPKRYLSVVIQAIAEAMSAEKSAEDHYISERYSPQNTSVVGSGADEQDKHKEDTGKASGKIDWTRVETFRKLRRGLRLPIALKLLDLTAEREGELVQFSEVAKAAGFTTNKQAASSLGAFTKVIKREFGVSYEDAIWPVKIEWSAKGDLQNYYRMTPQVADAWRKSA